MNLCGERGWIGCEGDRFWAGCKIAEVGAEISRELLWSEANIESVTCEDSEL